ncbi:SoxR reducing system RseC family protein [Peptoanaerobacter stomatis]|nr:SoxR reducing system RseC family protein [Peptoanaerobacter stomatis]
MKSIALRKEKTMKELGEVIRIEGKNAIVRVNRSNACGTCTACSMGMENKKFIELTVSNTVNASEKDIVELDMETPNILLAAFIMYGIPLISMLFGVMLGYYVLFKENVLASVISAFVFLIISFVAIRLNEEKIKASSKFFPTISRKIPQEYTPIA